MLNLRLFCSVNYHFGGQGWTFWSVLIQNHSLNCLHFDLQLYVNAKQNHLIKPNLHAETNPYGSDNMLSAGGREISYSKHLGRRKVSDRPRTQRNSPFTEKQALSSCHWWQGKMSGTFLSLFQLLATKKHCMWRQACYLVFFLLQNLSLHAEKMTSIQSLRDVLQKKTYSCTTLLEQHRPLALWCYHFSSVVWMKADGHTINCPIQP